jgi:hypothetical protein
MRVAADSFLDLDISCVLVVDDSMYGFDLLFQLRYGSFLESFGSHKLGLFNCFLRVFASVFSLIFRLRFVYGIPFFQHSLSTFHGRPLSSSHHAKIRLSLARVSSFFDLRKPQSGATHGRLRLTRLFFWSHCLEIPLEHSHGAWS